jgi:hypothetical protein
MNLEALRAAVWAHQQALHASLASDINPDGSGEHILLLLPLIELLSLLVLGMILMRIQPLPASLLLAGDHRHLLHRLNRIHEQPAHQLQPIAICDQGWPRSR